MTMLGDRETAFRWYSSGQRNPVESLVYAPGVAQP